MKWLCLALMLLVVACNVARADSSLAPLTGLKSVDLAVVFEGKEQLSDSKLIQSHVEKRLRDVGITLDSKADAFFCVDITLVRRADGTDAAAVLCCMTERVYRPSQPVIMISAISWWSNNVTLMADHDAEDAIEKSIDAEINIFCSDYQKDNPSGIPAVPATPGGSTGISSSTPAFSHAH